jgi:hypothetical protein
MPPGTDSRCLDIRLAVKKTDPVIYLFSQLVKPWNQGLDPITRISGFVSHAGRSLRRGKAVWANHMRLLWVLSMPRI